MLAGFVAPGEGEGEKRCQEPVLPKLPPLSPPTASVLIPPRLSFMSR